MYYLSIRTPQKKIYFYQEDQSVINFWYKEIIQSKKFYEWLNSFIELRYSKAKNDNKDFTMKADELMSVILGMTLPEIDVDLYSPAKGITVEEYARVKA
jgi:hypothetical protein